MATSHTTFTEAQIQDMSEFAYEDTKDEREQCPFCLSSSPGDVDLASHMALHMERLASFAFPRTQGNDESDSSHVSYRRDAQDDLSFMLSLRSVSLRFSDDEPSGSPNHVEDGFQNYAATTEDTGSSDDGVRQDGPTVPTDDEVAYQKYRNQRYPGTFQWFLDSEKYRMWTDNEEDSFLVLGAPAVGKSVLASVVIKDLYAEARRVASMGIILGVIGLFCETHAYSVYTEASSNSFSHALPGNLVSLNEEIFEAEEDDILLSQGTRRELLVRAARRTSRIFVVVDAPELLGNYQEFLQSISDLRNYGIKVNLLITSRSVSVGFGWHTHTTTIRATHRDISRFVRGSLKANPPSAPLDGILKQTVDFANGLWVFFHKYLTRFLFAKIHLDHLKASTRTDNEDSFDPNRSTPLVKLYTEAMIRVQKSPLSEWATTLIAWIALSESSLRLDKRAFEDLCTFRNSKSCPPTNLNLEAVIASCAGLVVVDSEGYLDFFHGTAKSFLASDRDYWFPGMAREQAETCCEYLSMEVFESGPCKTDFRWDERMVMHPFYVHAATSWGKYARKALDQEKSSSDPRIGEPLRRAITTFLSSVKAVQAAMQVVDAFKGDDSNTPEWDQIHDRLSVEVAAYFELTEIVDMLLLVEASKSGKVSEVRRLLKQGTHVHGFGPDSPLRSAISNDHKDVVGVLLKYGTDANFGSACEYPLDWAMDMEGEIGDITRLLLDYGADPTKIRTNLLSFAVRDEDMNMVKLLIEKGVDINAANENSWTALHFAAMNGLLDFVLILLKHLPIATAADLMGRTPLDYAEQNGKEAVVRRLRQYMHETI
ncbi:hypothetical protein GCG54_00011315 [Colletotrichum gloeosporioides]|uniref:Nephrocystin 3-like N-terminal domain-containing protein n=1 Tax=Colletotrichum gloeosporioides TaxID=474922 RepID=A0A8H4FQ63_COLGL|nr:uncharacterized protein GCG54_00011315 [Colletotrichum gloeosporioides]KAF3809119.1 hypothetical protein GCG54_00011315 [Colletotrichum gloeosporioides]